MRVVSRTKIKIYKTLCRPAVGRFVARAFRNRIHNGGCVIDIGSPLVAPEVKASLFWGFYEKAEIKFINRYLRRDLDAVELGGSLGVVTCQLRKRIDDCRRIVCIEANPELAALIRRNLNLNQLNENVSVIAKAIDYEAPGQGEVFFVSGEDSLGGRVTRRQTAENGFVVEETTLSQILHEHNIADYVLISDVEGAEVGIAMCEGEALKRCKQAIIEFHAATFEGNAVSVEQMCRVFIDVHGFKLRDQHREVCVFERV